MILTFEFSSLRCACGSADVMCVDPGQNSEIDWISDIMLRRGVVARGWCAECFTAFAALLPREGKNKKR